LKGRETPRELRVEEGIGDIRGDEGKKVIRFMPLKGIGIFVVIIITIILRGGEGV